MQIRAHPCLDTLPACDNVATFDLSSGGHDHVSPPTSPTLSSHQSSLSSPSMSPCSDVVQMESTFTCTGNMSASVPEAADKRYTIVRMTADDSEEVGRFLREFFLKDEPLNRSLDLGECPELEKWSIKCLGANFSFKAINTDGAIIGVVINGPIYKNVDEVVPDDVCKHQKFNAILELMMHVGRQFDLFAHYPQFDRALDGKIMSVNEAYRGVGICKELTRHTIEHMLSQGIRLYHVMCTSHYSALVCQRMGLKEIFRLNYRDYLVDGRQALRPAEPHDACRVFAQIF